MTVEELIEELQKLPKDAPVLTWDTDIHNWSAAFVETSNVLLDRAHSRLAGTEVYDIGIKESPRTVKAVVLR